MGYNFLSFIPLSCSVTGYGLPGGGHGLGAGSGVVGGNSAAKAGLEEQTAGVSVLTTLPSFPRRRVWVTHLHVYSKDGPHCIYSFSLFWTHVIIRPCQKIWKMLPTSLSPIQHPLRCLVQPRVQGPWFFCAGMWRTVPITGPDTEQMSQRNPSLITNGKEETSCHSLGAKSRQDFRDQCNMVYYS